MPLCRDGAAAIERLRRRTTIPRAIRSATTTAHGAGQRGGPATAHAIDGDGRAIGHASRDCGATADSHSRAN
jgi:hypothetical protein